MLAKFEVHVAAPAWVDCLVASGKQTIQHVLVQDIVTLRHLCRRHDQARALPAALSFSCRKSIVLFSRSASGQPSQPL